jgi:hypothetical protein
VTGVLGRASVPADKHFETAAAEYRVDVPDDIPRAGTLLRVHWTGDVGRAYVGETLVADQFYSGRVWEIGLDRLPADGLRAHGLLLRVLPLPADARVYLPDRADEAARVATVGRVEWVVARSWTVTVD